MRTDCSHPSSIDAMRVNLLESPETDLTVEIHLAMNLLAPASRWAIGCNDRLHSLQRRAHAFALPTGL